MSATMIDEALRWQEEHPAHTLTIKTSGGQVATGVRLHLDRDGSYLVVESDPPLRAIRLFSVAHISEVILCVPKPCEGCGGYWGEDERCRVCCDEHGVPVPRYKVEE